MLGVWRLGFEVAGLEQQGFLLGLKTGLGASVGGFSLRGRVPRCTAGTHYPEV